MTVIVPNLLQCAVCGNNGEHCVILSTNSIGYPDLDTRPPEMARSLIYSLIQRCHSCGYCSYDISKCKSKTKYIVASDEYHKIVNDRSMPNEAASYLALAYESAQYNDFVQAAWNVIRSAWICDDRSSIKKAVMLRKLALDYIAKAEARGKKIAEQDGASEAIKIDLLRRSGMFSEAMAFCEATKNADDDLLKVIKYQKKLIESNDVSAHTVSEALGKV